MTRKKNPFPKASLWSIQKHHKMKRETIAVHEIGYKTELLRRL